MPIEIDDLPIRHGVLFFFPSFFVCLPEGKPMQSSSFQCEPPCQEPLNSARTATAMAATAAAAVPAPPALPATSLPAAASLQEIAEEPKKARLGRAGPGPCWSQFFRYLSSNQCKGWDRGVFHMFHSSYILGK